MSGPKKGFVSSKNLKKNKTLLPYRGLSTVSVRQSTKLYHGYQEPAEPSLLPNLRNRRKRRLSTLTGKSVSLKVVNHIVNLKKSKE